MFNSLQKIKIKYRFEDVDDYLLIVFNTVSSSLVGGGDFPPDGKIRFIGSKSRRRDFCKKERSNDLTEFISWSLALTKKVL